MSSANDGRQAAMDPTQIYREDTFTDRRVGTIRRLTPVVADGAADAARPVLYVGQAQVMTPMGAVPISFELEAATLDAAIAKFGDAAEHAVQQTVRELAGNAPRAGLLPGDPRRSGRRDAEPLRSARPRPAAALEPRPTPEYSSARKRFRAHAPGACKRSRASRAWSGLCLNNAGSLKTACSVACSASIFSIVAGSASSSRWSL